MALFGLLVLASASGAPRGFASPAAAPTSSPNAGVSTDSTAFPTSIQHVFVIYLENQDLSSVQSNGPFEMHLANTYASATNYYAPCHPSAPNYLASTSGTTWQCGSDNYNTYTTENVFDLAQKAGLSWDDFSESMPSACDTTDTFPTGTYVAHHNPAIFYKNIAGNSTLCGNHDVSFSAWYNDVNKSTIPNFAFFAPNMDNDGHQTGTAYADKWLKGWLSPYLNASWFNSTVWFVTWDEGTSNAGPNGASGGGHEFFAAVSPYSKGGLTVTSNTGHYNLLTTEEWLLGFSSGACAHNDNWTSDPPLKGLFKFSSSSALSASASASPTSGTAPLAVTFTGGASGGKSPYSYAWSFGDGGSSTSQGPSHTYSSAGSYTATLTVTDANKNTSKSSAAITVSAPARLTASASASVSTGGAPLAVQFTGGASGGRSPYSYSWAFGDGTTSSSQSPAHTYSAVGNYTSTLTVTDAQSNTSSKSVVISVVKSGGALSATATASPASGAAPLLVQFQANPSGGTAPYTYFWKFAVGGSHHSTLSNPTDTYLYVGTYTATVTVNDSAGHSVQAQVQITVTTVGASLTAAASASVTTGTAPLAVQFTGGASGGTSPYSYSWAFGDGTSSNSQSPSHSFGSAGSYTSILTVTDASGNTAKSTVSLTVSAAITLSASLSASPTSGTAPLKVTFGGSGKGGSSPYAFSWNYGDGSSGTGTAPSHTYTSAGNYTATLTLTDLLGITAKASVAVQVSSASTALSAKASASPTSGAGPLKVQFDGNVTGGVAPYTYQWTFSVGGTRSASTIAATDTYLYAGTYTATFTVTDRASHTASAQVTITVTSTAPGYAQSPWGPLGGIAGGLSAAVREVTRAIGIPGLAALTVVVGLLVALGVARSRGDRSGAARRGGSSGGMARARQRQDGRNRPPGGG